MPHTFARGASVAVMEPGVPKRGKPGFGEFPGYPVWDFVLGLEKET